jgi:hypothetical protein
MADYGIPLADQTKLSGGFSTPPLPSTQPQLAPTQPPITAETEQKARAGQQFAWAPDQNKQVTGIQDTRDTEFRGRAARVAINQATEQTKAQTEQVKAQIVVVEGEIAQLNAQISDLNGQISGLNSQASSIEGQIGGVMAEAQKYQAQTVAAPAPTSQPAPYQSQGALASNVRDISSEVANSQEYVSLYNFYANEFMPKMWKAEEEALREINAYKIRNGNLPDGVVRSARAKYGAKYGVNILGEGQQPDGRVQRYNELSRMTNGVQPNVKIDQSKALSDHDAWVKSTGGDWRGWQAGDYSRYGY